MTCYNIRGMSFSHVIDFHNKLLLMTRFSYLISTMFTGSNLQGDKGEFGQIFSDFFVWREFDGMLNCMTQCEKSGFMALI